MSKVENFGQIIISPEIAMVGFKVGDQEISAALPPHRSSESDNHVVGVEETINNEGVAERRYLKIPKYLRATSQVAVEYYESHDALVKGVAAISVVAGMITMGSLVALRVKNKHS